MILIIFWNSYKMQFKFFKTNENSKKLLLFFNGYGMEDDFLTEVQIPNDFNCLIAYDYQNFDNLTNFFDTINRFNELTLVAWSLGVSASSYIFGTINRNYKLKKAIAINGTLDVLSNTNGIGDSVFEGTVKNWDIEVARKKFFQRVAGSIANFNRLDMPKNRSQESQKSELISLYHLYKSEANFAQIFDQVYIGKSDKIFPSENQKNYWNSTDIQAIYEVEDMGHFPFFNLDMEKLLNE